MNHCIHLHLPNITNTCHSRHHPFALLLKSSTLLKTRSCSTCSTMKIRVFHSWHLTTGPSRDLHPLINMTMSIHHHRVISRLYQSLKMKKGMPFGTALCPEVLTTTMPLNPTRFWPSNPHSTLATSSLKSSNPKTRFQSSQITIMTIVVPIFVASCKLIGRPASISHSSPRLQCQSHPLPHAQQSLHWQRACRQVDGSYRAGRRSCPC